MNKSKLERAIGDGNIVIPIYILKCFKKLNITMDEFIFLMYLYNKQDKIDFNPDKIANDLNLDIMEVMGFISVLSDKGYISLDVIKSDNNILEEVINLSNFYEKISIILLDNGDECINNKDNLLKYVEKELGRPLSSVEIQTVEGWLENKIDESLIKEAIKIALNDGVFSLKYIDRILFDFKSRGVSHVEDISNLNNSHDDNIENIDLEDWNWLDDDEEYITN